MTESEIQTEWNYRYQERLGMLCEGNDPTEDEKFLAKREADEWKARWQKENPC